MNSKQRRTVRRKLGISVLFRQWVNGMMQSHPMLASQLKSKPFRFHKSAAIFINPCNDEPMPSLARTRERRFYPMEITFGGKTVKGRATLDLELADIKKFITPQTPKEN